MKMIIRNRRKNFLKLEDLKIYWKEIGKIFRQNRYGKLINIKIQLKKVKFRHIYLIILKMEILKSMNKNIINIFLKQNSAKNNPLIKI